MDKISIQSKVFLSVFWVLLLRTFQWFLTVMISVNCQFRRLYNDPEASFGDTPIGLGWPLRIPVEHWLGSVNETGWPAHWVWFFSQLASWIVSVGKGDQVATCLHCSLLPNCEWDVGRCSNFLPWQTILLTHAWANVYPFFLKLIVFSNRIPSKSNSYNQNLRRCLVNGPLPCLIIFYTLTLVFSRVTVISLLTNVLDKNNLLKVWNHSFLE